ncbi:MAG: hypothetical protein JSW39_15905, partial [Desulfobacterales bacterium]
RPEFYTVSNLIIHAATHAEQGYCDKVELIDPEEPYPCDWKIAMGVGGRAPAAERHRDRMIAA